MDTTMIILAVIIIIILAIVLYLISGYNGLLMQETELKTVILKLMFSSKGEMT